MRVEELKLRATRISSALICFAWLSTGAVAAGPGKFDSPQVAFEQGLNAYKAGQYEIAVPALEEAAKKGSESNQFFADFYLARIYSDASGGKADRAKAYELYRK